MDLVKYDHHAPTRYGISWRKSCWKIMTALSFFRLMVDLEQSGTRIPKTWSKISTLSLKAAFYLTKSENRTWKALTQLSYYCFEYRYYFCQKCWVLSKKVNMSLIKGFMALKGIFSETNYLWVLTYQISSFLKNINEFCKGGGSNFTTQPHQN